MVRFIFQDGLHSSYWIVECDSYTPQDSTIYCDNSNIASFRNFSTLGLNESLTFHPKRVYKIIEQYRSLPDLTQDTRLLAV